MSWAHDDRPVERTIAEHLRQLRPSQRRGLSLWVCGAILAQSACQNAVVAAVLTLGHWHARRQHGRAWLYDGAGRSACLGR